MCMKVLKLGDEFLRQKALPIETIDENLQLLIQNMFITMHEKDGIGLAGPQVGQSIRLFIVAIDEGDRYVFINPQITSTSQETSMYAEGCLSIPGVYEEIERPIAITIQAQNEQGKFFSLTAEGLLARAIQHEYDHLEGVLFIDRGDPSFKQKTIESFEKKQERRLKKEAEKKAKQAKLSQKLASKEAKHEGTVA